MVLKELWKKDGKKEGVDKGGGSLLLGGIGISWNCVIHLSGVGNSIVERGSRGSSQGGQGKREGCKRVSTYSQRVLKDESKGGKQEFLAKKAREGGRKGGVPRLSFHLNSPEPSITVLERKRGGR